MGRGTQTVKSGFDALMGTRRGMSPGQTQERNKHIQDATWKAIWPQGLSADAARKLSDIASDTTPEVQEDLRAILQALVRTTGLTSFVTDWKESEGSLGRGLQDAIRDAVIAYLQEDSRSHLFRGREARELVESFFLDEEEEPRLSYSDLEAQLPLIEAIAHIYREERLGSGAEQSQGSCENLATCLGNYPSDSLPLFESWRTELTDAVTDGDCDTFLTGLTIMLKPGVGVFDDGKARIEHRAFLDPLLEAAEKRHWR